MIRPYSSLIMVLALAAPCQALIPVPAVPLTTEQWDAAIMDAAAPTTPETLDPEKTIERITQTAKEVGDRLKEKDTGKTTRDQQEQLLKDIESLLKQNTPPQSGGGGGGGGGGSDSSMGESKPTGGGGASGSGENKPMGGDNSSSSAESKPMGGGGNSNSGENKPMGGSGTNSAENKPKGGKPMPMSGENASAKENEKKGRARPQRMPREAGTKPMDPGGQEPVNGGPGGQEPMNGGPGGKEPMNGGPGGKDPQGGGKSTPALPLDDPLTKQVWGHLPEKLRQQVSQYYREQYMPRYSELLRQYYSTLSEKEKPARK